MNDAAILELPDDPALLKAVIAQRDTVIAEHEAALVGRQLQIERIKRESAAALAERDAAIEDTDKGITFFLEPRNGSNSPAVGRVELLGVGPRLGHRPLVQRLSVDRRRMKKALANGRGLLNERSHKRTSPTERHSRPKRFVGGSWAGAS
jgi:hypothetical protein